MYESFYGLLERPFELTPNPRYLFMTAEHREALCTIQYGLSGRKGMTLVLGPAGTGKTTLVHAALQAAHDNVRVLYLPNPALGRDEFFQFFAVECGLSEAARTSKTYALYEFRQWLVQRKEQNRATALIVDEAQSMPRALLEEVRLLTNITTATEQLLSIVLVGQAELSDRLNEPGLEQFKQRVALRSRLDPLDFADTRACITERIRIAGGDVSTVFTEEAIASIYTASRGIPRTINVICDNALVSGFALDERPVGPAVVAEVCRDFDLPIPGRPVRAAAPVSALPRPAAVPAAPPVSVAPAPAVAAPKPAVQAAVRVVAPATVPAPAAAMDSILAPAIPMNRLITPNLHGPASRTAAPSPDDGDDETVTISAPRRGLFGLFARSRS